MFFMRLMGLIQSITLWLALTIDMKDHHKEDKKNTVLTDSHGQEKG